MAPRHYALGRLKQGVMNRSESAYSQHLELLRRAGEVLWFKFEGIKLRLADNTFLTVDFAVMYKDGRLALEDVKGSKAIFSDDARVKMKCAADQFPLIIRAVYPVKGGGWSVEEF